MIERRYGKIVAHFDGIDAHVLEAHPEKFREELDEFPLDSLCIYITERAVRNPDRFKTGLLVIDAYFWSYDGGACGAEYGEHELEITGSRRLTAAELWRLGRGDGVLK